MALANRTFTWKELSKLNQRHNAHVAVRGKVYDVSSFVERHPGGVDQIMLGAGRDVTQLFESYHSVDTYKVLEKYYVGVLIDNELPVFPSPSKFYPTLKRRVQDHFKASNTDPKICYRMFLLYAIYLAAAIAFWLGTLLCYDNLPLVSLCSLGWGVFSALVALTAMHDASHFSVTHSPWVWKLLGSVVHDIYNGASLYVWTNQHILGHHLYTNIDGADPDVVTSTEPADVRRIKWTQKWLPFYFYQHIYIPILYCLLGIKTRLQDVYILISLKNGPIRVNPPTLSQVLFFSLGKCFHVTYRFVIPLLVMPWYTMLLTNLIAEAAVSYWLAFFFQGSHVVGEVEWPVPDSNNEMHMDWAEMQVATTQDYATDSWFWTLATGALNHQTTHHLFPGINQGHYAKITPIVKKTCEDFGLKYHCVSSTSEALGCHINHLKTLGRNKHAG